VSAGYGAALRAPGALGVFVPSVVGRLSFAMEPLGCVVLVASTTGSYAVAGAATGLLGLANVVVAPFRARIVDRVGQRLGLRVLASGFAAAALALVAAATLGAAVPLLLVAAALAGAFAPPVGAAMRMRWRLLVPPEHVPRAYSLDSVSEEIVYTLGPPLAGLLMAATVPQAGLIASAVCALAGCFAMTRGATAPPPPAPAAASARPRARLLRAPGFTPALVLMAAVGIVLGAVGVIVPAQTAPDDLLAGLLLGALSLGSAVGGLAYGSRTWRSAPVARLVLLAVAMTASCALLAVAGPLWVLAVLLVVAGLALAPAMVSGYLVVDDLTDDRSRLEAHTWVNTALNAGTALAAAAAGFVIDGSPAPLAYLLTAGVALVLVAGGALWLLLARRARE
jgi:MFS family permease